MGKVLLKTPEVMERLAMGQTKVYVSLAAEGEQSEGDEGLGGLEPERHPGDQPDFGVGRLDQAVGPGVGAGVSVTPG